MCHHKASSDVQIQRRLAVSAVWWSRRKCIHCRVRIAVWITLGAAAIGCVWPTGQAMATDDEYAYTLHLQPSTPVTGKLVVAEGNTFDVDVALFVDEADPDGNADNNFIAALVAWLRSDSDAYPFLVTNVVWLPYGPAGIDWLDFNDDEEVGFAPPPTSGYPQDLTATERLRLVGMFAPDETTHLSVDDIGAGLVVARITMQAPTGSEVVGQELTLSFLTGGGYAPSAANNLGERQIATASSTLLTVLIVRPDCIGGPNDCNNNGIADHCDIEFGLSDDCNENAVPDECDIAGGTSGDCDANGTPDECQSFDDCNHNGIVDFCDTAAGTSEDCDGNHVPDECQVFDDCNNNGTPDPCDIRDGVSEDCSSNGIPDECEPDCNNNGIADTCDILEGTSADCSGNNIPDECEPDCNGNNIADSCDIVAATSQDCDLNGIPDECEDTLPDCNNNGIWDACDIVNGSSTDCNANWIPDVCEMGCGGTADQDGTCSPSVCSATGYGNGITGVCDCNNNGAPDECDIAGSTSHDCDGNHAPDECAISGNPFLDRNINGLLDVCEDCDSNGIPDTCDLDCSNSGCSGIGGCGLARDDNANGIPDECEIGATDDVLSAGPEAQELYVIDLATLEGGRSGGIYGISGTSAITGMASDPTGDVVYVTVDPGTPRTYIYRVHVSDGQAEQVAVIQSRSARAVAFEASLGLETLYVGVTAYPGDEPLLLVIDPQTGETVFENPLDTGDEYPTGFAYDSRHGLLYGVFSQGSLYSFVVNELSGRIVSTTCVGRVPQPLGNLAYDPARDRLLAVAEGYLYTVDRATADVGCVGAGFVDPPQVAGLAYCPSSEPLVDISSWPEFPIGSGRGAGLSGSCVAASAPDLAINPSTGRPLVAYAEDGAIAVLRYEERLCGGELIPWREVTGTRVSRIEDAEAKTPAVAIITAGDPVPVVVWSQTFDNPPGGPDEIYVRRLNATMGAWEEMGTASASARGISNTLANSCDPVPAVMPSGDPVIAWVDKNDMFDFEQVYVRQWSSIVSDWVEMGSGSASGYGVSASAGRATDVALVIDGTSQPVLAWADTSPDTGGDYNIYVLRWNGVIWDELGTGSAGGDGITGTSPYDNFDDRQPALASDSQGSVYVAWSSCVTTGCAGPRQIKVLKWDGAAWAALGQSIGISGISGTPGVSVNPSVIVDANSHVVVAWCDETTSPSQILVRKWNGMHWVEVGAGSGIGAGISGTLYSGDARQPVLAVAGNGGLLATWAQCPTGDREDAQSASQILVRGYGFSVDDPCLDCLDDGDCDDGLFCNGAETCDSGGICQPGDDPCPGGTCDEGTDSCLPDCNTNGIPDNDDIAGGTSLDCNNTGVPDECETIGSGDIDGDDDVDLTDFAAFVDCLAGPAAPPNPQSPECVQICLDAFDFDSDGNLDLNDFSGFQAAFTGPR
ncbi:MAG: hypothetical protein KAV82_03470 [Phycisphaerae bacterium]|nr:hypothetical protein [Phycisphaerae bacterium]